MKNENQIQQEIYVFYTNNYCLKKHEPRGIFLAVPNGGSRNIVEAVNFKKTGTLKGASDLIVILPNGKLFFCEVKIEKGIQSDAQKDFQSRVEILGYEYHIVRSLEEFKKIIDGTA